MFGRSAAIQPNNEKCNLCGTTVTFLEIQKYGLRRPGGGIQCVECVGVAESAYRAFQQGVTAVYLPNQGKTTMRCQGWCSRTLEEIWKVDRTYSMFVHFKDGENQMLCPQCSERFSLMATGLYAGTAFDKKAGRRFTPYLRFKKAVDRLFERGGRLLGR